ncbi:uncharacterized protein [Periplaneta americana]|uniref:uncharacterized protein isoform X3 n=1 Tax=Periplaneta americana TaxID=6978 RepID=UPI0037E94DB0
MASSNTQRKRIVLTIDTKLKLLSRLEKGESASSLAREYSIGKSTISDIKRNKDSILQFAAKLNSEDGSKKRKTMRDANDSILEQAVYTWFVQRRAKRDPISGPLLCEKALELNKKLGGSSDFKASTGWLKNFKSRHGIRELQIEGECLSSDATFVNQMKQKFQDMVKSERYSRDDLYNQAIRSHEERIVTGAQQKQSLQEYEDRSSNLYEDQQQIPELLEVESKPLLEIPLITLTHTQEDDFENRITSEVQSSGMAPQTSEFRLPETITLQRVTRKSDNIRITGDVQSSGMAPQTSEFRPPETLPMPRLARKLDSIRQVTTSEPGPSTQNPSVTVVCAPELSTMRSSSPPSETSEDPLALLSDPTYEPRTVRPRRFQNASKSVSITLGPKPLSSRNEVTVEYFGGGSETNVNATEEYEEQQQDGRNIEKVLLQLRAEKLLLEMEKLKQERLKMEAEKRNIKLRNEILSLRIHLAKPQDTISSSDHPTTTRTTRESSSNLTTSVSVQREPSQNAASSATTKHLPLQEESLRISCMPQHKSSQCQSSSPDATSAKCQTYEHAAHPATGGKERTSKKSNETRQFSSGRAKEGNYKASSMPVKSSDEELTRKTRIDCSESEQVSLPTPYLKEEGEEHFTTEQALFYSAVHGERDVERDATRHSTLLVGSLDRSELSDSSIHESDSILEVESMCRSRDLGCGREETQRGGGFPISKGESLVGQSDINTDTVRTEQRKKSHGSFQQMSPVIGSREKVGEVGSFHFHDVYSKKSESKRLFESADSCALNEEGTVVKKKRVESIGRVQSSGVE